MKEFKFESSSSSAIYTTRINDNGLLSCDCRGWTIKKLGKARMCKHTTEVGANLSLIERDGQMFVEASASVTRRLDVQAPAAEPSATNFKNAVKKEAAKTGFVNPMLASAMPAGLTADSYAPAEFVMEEK